MGTYTHRVLVFDGYSVLILRPVGSSRGVERPSGVRSEATQRLRVAREAWEKFCDLFFGGKESCSGSISLH